MTTARGSRLLHDVAVRIIARYLTTTGRTGVTRSDDVLGETEAIDLVFFESGSRVTAKVKADAYYGSDAAKVSQRDLVFYRESTGSYGLEVLADTFTRQPGWLQRSRADKLYYYRLAISQPEDEVAALMDEPDDVFFSEIAVERDDLRIIPMRPLQDWFMDCGDRYAPRPVLTDGRSAWYRIVPETELEAAIRGVERVGSVFSRV